MTIEPETAEAEANYFARCLLVPEGLLRSELTRFRSFDAGNDRHIMSLAKKFAVPIAVIVQRLAELGK